MNPILMAITPDRSATFTATVVIAGIGIVVAMLILLILIFQLYGKIMQGKGNKKATKAEKKQAPAAPAPKPVAKAPAAAPVVENGISGEVVAAISAAVYQLDAENGGSGNTVIRSIRKVQTKNVGSRNPWAAAAIADNTRPF